MLRYLSSLPPVGIEPVSLGMKAWSSNHWTTKEFSDPLCLLNKCE